MLIVDATQLVTVRSDSDITLNYDCLYGYLPYHEDFDIEGRQPDDTNEVGPQNDDNDDSYIVEKILEKRFHQQPQQRNQYEYLVKWVGYDNHTWEVPDNIPDRIIQQYENTTIASRNPTNASCSLRPTRKLIAKDDFIKTL